MPVNIEIREGDCLELMQTIPTGTIDMILCDLPYGVTQNEKDRPLDLPRLWAQYRRITKPTAAIVLTAQFPYSAGLVTSNPSMFRYDLIWDKILVSGHLNAHRMPLRCHEHILVFYKMAPIYHPQMSQGPPRHSEGQASRRELTNRNYGKWARLPDIQSGNTFKFPRSIISIQKPHPSKAQHPTEKPVTLCEWLIRTYTNEGETVLDNCLGSGTTALACFQTNRHCIGMELDPTYISLARKRIANAC